MVTRSGLVALAICCAACTSYPVAPIQAPPLQALESPESSDAFIIGCDPEPKLDQFLTCDALVSRLAFQLREAAIFHEVHEGTPPTDVNVSVIVVRPYEYQPYFLAPAHNPALALLSIVIPFWWSEPLGYRFEITQPAAPRRFEVDTTWNGTFVMWGLSSLVNLAPSRTFESTHSQDLKRIRLALGLLPLSED